MRKCLVSTANVITELNITCIGGEVLYLMTEIMCDKRLKVHFSSNLLHAFIHNNHNSFSRTQAYIKSSV